MHITNRKKLLVIVDRTTRNLNALQKTSRFLRYPTLQSGKGEGGRTINDILCSSGSSCLKAINANFLFKFTLSQNSETKIFWKHP